MIEVVSRGGGGGENLYLLFELCLQAFMIELVYGGGGKCGFYDRAWYHLVFFYITCVFSFRMCGFVFMVVYWLTKQCLVLF